MQAGELALLLKPFRMMAEPNALSPTYKAVELSAEGIRGCSSYGLLEVGADLGIQETIYVNAQQLIAIVSSVSESQEFMLAPKDGVLAWKCGRAKGQISTLAVTDMPARPEEVQGAVPPAGFKAALELGGLSADVGSLAAIGMYGVVVVAYEDATMVCSSDDATVSIAYCDGSIKGFKKLTLPPAGAELLSSVLAKKGSIRVEVKKIKRDEENFDLQKRLFYTDKRYNFLLSCATDLKHNIPKVVDQYAGDEIVVKLPVEAVRSFVKRVTALSLVKREAQVQIYAIGAKNGKSGRIAVSFADDTSSTDETYLMDDLQCDDMPAVKLNAAKLARALSHADEMVLDHMSRGVLVLRGAEPEFRYIIAGATVTE